MSRLSRQIRARTPGISRWPSRYPMEPGVPCAARPAPHSPRGAGRTVGVATTDDDAVPPSSPHVVVAALTVFEGQVVFRAELPGLVPSTLLFRLRRGSRRIIPSENRP
ncbi:hypothetical protein DAH51_19310 [Sphingobium yanoikuyae]|uniref:Uncharacterized protein n=1 Tax=Sphingobium yanoikuyae TaxID=13690 RepID=A0A430BQ32_SPHYA|nr:hypothetical protein DAH51_19310 [Sphingobium yanoikuyae]